MERAVLSGERLAVALNADLDGQGCGEFLGADTSRGAPAILTRGRFVAAVNPVGDEYRIAFWRDHQELAHGWIRDTTSAARSARLWTEGAGLERLAAAFPFVAYTELQLAREQGRAREAQWQIVLREMDTAYGPLVDLASKDVILSRLFPYLGHRFALARDEDSEGVLASVFIVRPGTFRIYEQGGEDVEFEGGAFEVCSYLSAKLGSALGMG